MYKMIMQVLQDTGNMSWKTPESLRNVDSSLMTAHVQCYAPQHRQLLLHSNFNLHTPPRNDVHRNSQPHIE